MEIVVRGPVVLDNTQSETSRIWANDVSGVLYRTLAMVLIPCVR